MVEILCAFGGSGVGKHKAIIFHQDKTNAFICDLVISQEWNIVGSERASIGCTEI
jgi:hypothetical protein